MGPTVRYLLDFVDKVRSEGSFARNFAITFSGNLLAILVGLASTPFIARIYSPEAYGLFAFFISVTQNLAIVSTLQLPRAFVLPEKESEFNVVFSSTIGVTLVTVCIIAGVFVSFSDRIFAFTVMESAHRSLLAYLIPFAVLLYAVNDILRSWGVRRKYFTMNAITQLSSSMVSRGTTLIYGVATSGSSLGLIIGDLISKIIEGCYLGKRFWNGGSFKFAVPKKNDIVKVLVRYKSYPIFLLPGIWIQAIITQLPVYFAVFFFDPASAGYYSFANSLLNLPVNMLAGSLAPVFLQKATDTFRRDPHDLGRIVTSLADKLFLVGLFPMIMLMGFGDYLFRYLLGSQWVTSGVMASYMGIYFFFLVIHYPLVSMYRIFGKEHINLLTNLLALLLAATAWAVGVAHNDFMLGIILFSAGNAIFYLINIYIILKLSGLKPLPILFKWIAFFALAFFAMLLLKGAIERFMS